VLLLFAPKRPVPVVPDLKPPTRGHVGIRSILRYEEVRLTTENPSRGTSLILRVLLAKCAAVESLVRPYASSNIYLTQTWVSDGEGNGWGNRLKHVMGICGPFDVGLNCIHQL
jgi:hypothetical protein